MKKVFQVKFNRKNRTSYRYDIAVFYDVRSDCFGSDQVGQIQQSEFALWSGLYYLQDRVEFWVHEDSSEKHYVFKTEDYGTRRKALSAAKKFVVEFFERNENTIRAFETGGHNKCHCGNERCKSEKVESIYDCWPDLVTFEQAGWPKVSTLGMTDEEVSSEAVSTLGMTDEEVSSEAVKIGNKYALNLESLSGNAYLSIYKLDETYVGSTDYMGLAYFWHFDYRHFLRDTTTAKKRKVHNKFLESGIQIDGKSDAHLALIRSIVKQ